MKRSLRFWMTMMWIAVFSMANATTSNWYGYALYTSNGAAWQNHFISFDAQDPNAVQAVSETFPSIWAATYLDGYVWFVTQTRSLCKAPFDEETQTIGNYETVVPALEQYNLYVDMAYNPIDGMIYYLCQDSQYNCYLKRSNLSTPSEVETVGSFNVKLWTLAINGQGQAYGVAYEDGNLHEIDLNNATTTVVGPTGKEVWYTQSMAFDLDTGELYWAQFATVNDHGFYRVDTETGQVTSLGDIGNGTQLAGLFKVQQSTFTVGDLNYRINDDGVSVTVTGHVVGNNATGELVIPESVNHQGNEYAVTTIGNNAFYYCTGFRGDLVIPNSVITIEPRAFQVCYGFDGNLTLGNSVTTIGDNAFNSCDRLTGILNIPSSVESLSGNAFGYCRFDGIVVDPGNSVYDSREDCNAIIVTSTNELITGCKNTTIPNTVTTIGNNAFEYIVELTSISIPNSVVSIGDNAFAFCVGLTGDLTIPNSVTTIGTSAFLQCAGINGTLTIGESVTYIGDEAFRGCFAYRDGTNFTAAVSLATTPPVLGNELGGMVFDGFWLSTLTVPCGCAEAYQNSDWYDPTGSNGFSEFIEDCSAVPEVEPVVSAVYPNPTHGMIKVEAENIKNICIYNILGEKVFEGSASGNVFDYDFSNQASGLYLIRVETAKGVTTKRVTVR